MKSKNIILEFKTKGVILKNQRDSSEFKKFLRKSDFSSILKKNLKNEYNMPFIFFDIERIRHCYEDKELTIKLDFGFKNYEKIREALIENEGTTEIKEIIDGMSFIHKI